MAVVIGTNSGFVTVSPTADPQATSDAIDTKSFCFNGTTPLSVNKITEVGWWCDNNTQETNFEVGLYATDGGSGYPGTRLYISSVNAKGTTSGWKKVSVDWDITGNTTYWVGLQVDDTSTNTNWDITVSRGQSIVYKTSATSLPNPYVRSGGRTDTIISLYALVSQVTPGPANLKSYNTNLKANIKTINTNPIANVKSLNTNV